ncbi:MAG: two-component regulator propeller domain-containing protein [Candidatus Latescibacterota bacterium]
MRRALLLLFLSALPFGATKGACHTFEQYSYINLNFINEMARDGDFIWCAAMGGVVRWDTRDGSCETWTERDGLIWKDVYAVAVDRDGITWFGYRFHAGVTSFDGISWKTYYEPTGHIETITVDQNNVKWFCGHNGATSFDGNTWKYHPETQPEVWAAAVDRNNGKWFGTYDQGVLMYQGTGWTRSPYEARMQWVHDIAFDRNGKAWIASGEGLWSYDGVVWTSYREQGLTGWTNCVAVDSSEVVWMGAGGTGLKRFDGATVTTVSEADGLANNAVQDVLADEDGVLWAGTTNGLSRFDGREWKTYRVPGAEPHYRWNMAIDRTGIRWYAPGNTGGAGAFVRYDDGAGMKTRRDDPISANYRFVVTVDAQNRKWFGSQEGALCFDGDMWTKYTVSDGLADNHVVAVAPGPNGVLWCGTNRGVSRFDGVSWKTFTESDGLAANTVRAICVERSGAAWFGTTAGVSRFDGVSWKTYGEADGLPSRSIYAAALDSSGGLWFGTRGGAARFDGMTWRSYTESDGLIYNRINVVAIDRNNVKWFATDRGISRFDGVSWRSFAEREGLSPPLAHSLAVDDNNTAWYITSKETGCIRDLTVSVSGKEEQPQALSILGNHPNPFNPNTTIEFTLSAPGKVSLTVYDITGRKVRELVTGHMSAGKHRAVWDGKDAAGASAASGIYFSRLESGGKTVAAKMLLVR